MMFRPVLWRATDPDGGVHHFCRQPENVATEVAWSTPDGRATIHHGDCLEVMRGMDAATYDAIVTDPPYGLAFMGKAWDSFTPGDSPMRRTAERDAVNAGASRQGGRQRACADYAKRQARDMRAFQESMEAWAVEALRVAKPGAHLLAFGGTRTFHRLTCAIEDAGWEIRDCLSYLYGSGFPKSHNGAWGGTALKPAWEPVVLARKPLIGTVEANHAAHGTGALNIDGCRIGTAGGTTKGSPPKGASNGVYGDGINGACDIVDIGAGRWPANVALDEEAARALDEQSGERPGAVSNGKSGVGGVHEYGMGSMPQESSYGDSGGASRFFYTAKASRSEREAGLTGAKSLDGGVWGGAEDDLTDGKKRTVARANTHPTVKPVDLMRWLVRLVTPLGGTVLDPFLGSGTTGVAALQEGCRFVGIEREAPYVEIAKARIANEAKQGSLFGGVS